MSGGSREQPRQVFTRLCAAAPTEWSVGEVGLWIAAEEYPGLEVGAYLERFDRLAEVARPHVVVAPTPRAQAEALAAYLAGEVGLRGNAEAYYDPRNSFLNDVLDRQLGIPISLSVVLIEVGARLGLDLHGVGLPGHFLVRGPGPIWLDPFYGGRSLDSSACQRLLGEVTGGQVPYHPALLEPISARDLVVRLLRNLKGIYARLGDPRRTLAALDRILIADTAQLVERRERGLVQLKLGAFARAVEDLTVYVEGAPHAPDRAAVLDALTEARRRLWELN